MDQLADFLQQVDLRVRQAQRTDLAKVSDKESEVRSTAPVEEKKGGARQRKTAVKDQKEAKSELEESAVLMEKAQ